MAIIQMQFVVLAVTVIFVSVSISYSNENTAQDRQQSNDRYLQAAINTANWLESVQQTNSEGDVFWPKIPDDSNEFSFDLYHGNAGVIGFYLALHEQTFEKKYLNTALAAADHLIKHVEQMPDDEPLGMYTGVASYGVTLIQVWETTNTAKYKDAAIRCVEHIKKASQRKKSYPPGAVHFNGVTDLIGGSAGICNFLLASYRALGHKESLELAINCADGLVADARITSDENGNELFRWRVNDDWEREYPNVSHGTAGICGSLIELDIVCMSKKRLDYDGRFFVAAEKGIRYLKSIAKVEDGQWLVFHHTPGGEDLYYLGWCHGPPGTSLVLLRYAVLTEDKEMREAALMGAKAVLIRNLAENRTPGFWNNVGRCCGTSGVADFLHSLNTVTAEKSYVLECRKLSDDLLSRATVVELKGGKKGLKWIQAENRVDPDGVKAQTGFMQGAAGIGDWLLKMHRLENK